MTKNPFINALAAFTYIVGLLFFMANVLFARSDAELGIFAPMIALSLFVLSAALMGYLFLYEPGALYFEGRRKEAVTLFLQTVGVFAVLVFALILFVSLVPLPQDAINF